MFCIFVAGRSFDFEVLQVTRLLKKCTHPWFTTKKRSKPEKIRLERPHVPIVPYKVIKRSQKVTDISSITSHKSHHKNVSLKQGLKHTMTTFRYELFKVCQERVFADIPAINRRKFLEHLRVPILIFPRGYKNKNLSVRHQVDKDVRETL